MRSTGDRDAAREARRRRILDVALELAAGGGLDGLQLRDVAARAGVSTRTLYKYFPTKNGLLVSALADQRERFARYLARSAPLGGTRAERVVDSLRVLTETMQAAPKLTSGMIAALVSGEPGIALVLESFIADMGALIVGSLAEVPPTAEDEQLAAVLAQVWFAALVGWATGAQPAAYVLGSVEQAARLLGLR